MKKAFGIIQILIAFCITGIIVAIFFKSNPIVTDYTNIVEQEQEQEQEVDELIEQVNKLKEQNADENQAILNNFDE